MNRHGELKKLEGRRWSTRPSWRGKLQRHVSMKRQRNRGGSTRHGCRWSEHRKGSCRCRCRPSWPHKVVEQQV